MSAPRFSTVEDYLTSLDPTKARTLRTVMDFILSAFPQLECKIAWNVPQIHRNGKYVFGFAAFKNHLTLAPWSARIIEQSKARLDRFVVKRNCFQVPVDWEMDKELLKALVRARIAELDQR